MTDQTGMKAGGRAPKKYDGEYPAQVTNVDDPDGHMRVQVRVVDIFENVAAKDLPWAEYKLPVGVRPNDGFFTPVDVDDWVWVNFPHSGDTRRPRITGGMHFCPNGDPNMPHEAWDGPGSHTHKRTGPQLTPTAAAYHRDVVLTQHGVLIEIVSGTGEVRVTQKESGSAIEIDRDGNVTAHSEKNLYGSSANNVELDVGNDLKARVTKKAEVIAEESAEITSPTITANGDVIVNGSIECNGPISSSGSMFCKGSMTCVGAISSKSNINAAGSIIDGGGNTNHHSH